MKLLFLVTCLFIAVKLSLAKSEYPFEIALKELKDVKYSWRFPEGHPFTYFKSTKSIGESFLPVKIDNLPERHGVWVLRRKDFLEVPYTFSESWTGQDTASVNFFTRAIFYHSVKIRFFLYGEVSVYFKTDSDYAKAKVHKEVLHQREKISLGGAHYQNCTNVSKSTSMKWVTYDIQVKAASKMQLDVTIDHPRSFMILDDIVVSFEEETKDESGAEDESGAATATYNWSSEGETEENWKKTFHVKCSVDED